MDSAPEAGAPALFLFSHDLRLDDHAGLTEATRHGAVVPALVLDPTLRERAERSPRRAAFFYGAALSLARSLQERGARLIVRRGPLISATKRLAREVGARTVAMSAQYDATSAGRQRRLQSSLEESGLRVALVHDAPAVPPDATASVRSAEGGTGYRAFAPYFAAWVQQARTPLGVKVRFAAPEVSSEELPAPSEFDAAHCEGPSEARAMNALDAYLAGPALQYLTARNVPSSEATSRLSGDLSFGTISARTVLARIDERMRDPFLLAEERRSLRELVRALAQRDFFLQLAWFFEGSPDALLQERMRRFPSARSHAGLGAWRDGRTGFALIDAGIRQLHATGWMHPRVRLVAASFLCFDLGVDWRVGRDEWERYLVEDEPALANGNWQWSAGVGADLAQFPRIYNPVKQLRSFDPRAAYARTWLPELAAVPDVDILDPTGATRRMQLSLPLFDGSTYPKPIVDHDQAARAFLARYAGFIKNAGVRR